MDAAPFAKTAARRVAHPFRSHEPDPAELSWQLRHLRTAELSRRRKIVGLCLLASGAMGVIALYQTGIIRRLPDPPIPGIDSNRVNAAPEAYAKLRAPDALLGLGSYAVTATLAAAGGAGRARRRSWLPVALGIKALADSGQAAKLTWDQWAKHKAFCIYCLAAAAATFLSLPLALKDAQRGVQELTTR